MMNKLRSMARAIRKIDWEDRETHYAIFTVLPIFLVIITVSLGVFVIARSPDVLAALTSEVADDRNLTNGGDDDLTGVHNETLELRLQDSFPTGTSIDGSSNLTQRGLTRQFTNNSEAANATFAESEEAYEERTCLPYYGMLSSITSYMIAYYLHSKAKNLKELLLLHLFAFYSSLLCFHVIFLTYRSNNAEDEGLMYTSASFAHFFLLELVSWTTIISYEDFLQWTFIIRRLQGKGVTINLITMSCCSWPFAFFIMFDVVVLFCTMLIVCMGSNILPFCWTTDESPPTFINSVLGLVATNLLFFLKYRLNEPRVRKRSTLFLGLSVMTYIMWGVDVLASYLSLSLLRKFFIITFFSEGLVLVFIYKKCAICDNDCDYDLAAFLEMLDDSDSDFPITTNTVASQGENTSNGKV